MPDAGNELNETPRVVRPRYREALFSAISVGFFFLLVGLIFIITPNLFDKVAGPQGFFQNFKLEPIPHLQNVSIPAPANPGNYSTVYSAVWKFSIVWGLFQIFILALRFIVGSPFSKKAETASNMVFWLGTSYVVGMFLNEMTTMEKWFGFWAAIVMLIGVSLVVRAVILAARLAVP